MYSEQINALLVPGTGEPEYWSTPGTVLDLQVSL